MKTITGFITTLVCLFALSVSSISAQNSFFLDQAGTVAEYVIKDAKGNVQSYFTMTVADVNKKDDKNFTVTYTTEAFDKNKKSLAAPTTTTTEIVDGVLIFDPKASLGESGANAEVTGTFSTFPAELEVGQNVGDYSYTLKMSGVSTTTTGKGKVTAQESVTTEAGSFNCYKIESEVSTKVMFSTTKAKSNSWYAKGAGAVKTEVCDGKGKVLSVQELISLKK